MARLEKLAQPGPLDMEQQEPRAPLAMAQLGLQAKLGPLAMAQLAKLGRLDTARLGIQEPRAL